MRNAQRHDLFRATSTHRSASSTVHRAAVLVLGLGVLGVAVLNTAGPVGAVGPTLPKGAVTTRAAAQPPAKKAAPKAKKASSKAPAKSSKSSSSKSSSASGIGMGARGPQVMEIQERLMELKYDITEAEGQFGDQTFHAVMAFQKANGLSRTGRVGPQTLAAMSEATAPEPMMPNGGDNRIEVDLKRQILMMWENGELYRIISVSSGNGKDYCAFDPDTGKTECDTAITPTGSYRITRRWVGWRESKLGEMYNPLYFNAGYAIHGSQSVPGYPASHGCVRVPMVTAEWLPGVIEDGTPIYVFGVKDTDKKPVAFKPRATTVPKASTIPGSTVPGSPTVPGSAAPGATVPPATTPIPSTTTTTLVRPLDSGPTTAASTVLPSPTVVPSPTVASSVAPTSGVLLPTG
jgi:peptidoglycan hydrolase-like protein with peptidoglycan-binding domain